MRTKFLGIGDTFKSEIETLTTHKGMNYPVSHVFNDNGKFRVFLSDKNGKDFELDGDYYFTATAKTVKLSNERQMKAKLEFLWNNPASKFVINRGYKAELKEYISFSKGYVSSYGYTGPYAKVSRSTTSALIEGSQAELRSLEDVFKYFKGIEAEDMTIDGMFYTNQADIDHIQYMLSIPTYDESVLDLLDIELTEINQYIHRTKPELDVFLKLCAEVIFDEPELSADNKKIIYNAIEAFELSPKSFGPTAVSKLLMGKEKKESKTVAHLSGTCTTLKQPQAFEICNMVDSFMYMSKIFVKTDDYASADEWRGAYEFIGSKAINTAELQELKNKLS